MTVDKFPEFFTFGLLEAWDIPDAGQWQALFDGKTSAGWRTLAKPQFPTNGGWAVEDGTTRPWQVANASTFPPNAVSATSN